MKRKLAMLACAALILAAAGASAFAQAPSPAKPKVDLSGTWIGFTLVGDGSRADLTLTLEKTETGYTGKITNEAGLIPEMAIKNVTFKDAVLSFEVDLPQDMGTQLISIELKHDAGTLKGHWTDPNGESNIIELEKKK